MASGSLRAIGPAVRHRIIWALALALSCSACAFDGEAGRVLLAVVTGAPSAAPERPLLPGPAAPAPLSPVTAVAEPAAQLIADEATMVEAQVIRSEFDRRRELLKDIIPRSAAPDVVGAFRFICNAGHLSRDDPIVYPGQQGRSHLHQFFGNTLTNADSTYQSLRTTGDSTCMGPLNRSAYWVPAMMNGAGKVVRPDFVSVYYKRRPKSDPECRQQGRGCVTIPRGLRFVFGYDMLDPTSASTGEAYWNCQGPGAVPGHYETLEKARKFCPPGSQIGALIIAPDCWDGINLDSPNHRSHIAYGSYGSTGTLRCPASHPWIIPQFTLGVWYTSDASLPNWYLSSDRMPGMATAESGATLHSDWWGAWDDETLAAWTENCIDKMLNCSDGQLGDGTIMKRHVGFGYIASPRLVSAP